MTIANIILLLGISHGVLLSFFIFSRIREYAPNRMLFLFITACNFVLINLLLTDLKFEMKFPYAALFLDGFVYLPGPLFYLYVRTVVTGENVSLKKNYHHFLLFVIYLIFTLPDYFKSEQRVIDSFAEVYSEGPPLMSILFNWTIIVQIAIYLWFSIHLLRKQRMGLQDYYSSANRLHPQWLEKISYLLSAGLGVYLLENVLFLLHVNLSYYFTLSSVIFGLSIYSLGYISLIKSREMLEMSAVSRKNGKSYRKSGLSVERKEMIAEKLISCMENEKPYKNSTLSLADLSTLVKIPAHNISEVLNTKLNLSFYEFINRYRIKEAGDLLLQEKERSVLDIAYECGFNSKSTFNKFFKQYYQMTPSEFRAGNS